MFKKNQNKEAILALITAGNWILSFCITQGYSDTKMVTVVFYGARKAVPGLLWLRDPMFIGDDLLLNRSEVAISKLALDTVQASQPAVPAQVRIVLSVS